MNDVHRRDDLTIACGLYMYVRYTQYTFMILTECVNRGYGVLRGDEILRRKYFAGMGVGVYGNAQR